MHLLDMFSSRRKKVADLDELEDFLYDYLSDHLRVEAEDGSVEQVRRARLAQILSVPVPLRLRASLSLD